ncbi:torsin-1A-interacting protein 2-like isoform X2 [Lampris incognitus]|uniref:torsin-1A-interacting protein 2-like isoform X2 n=1 Tax=Lampris incognitus TaxID=2546036 RepID=UPI0024B57A0F|nr:torsin-1A-interacting protein 2-like isoform X2 [Lampris incognitus]
MLELILLPVLLSKAMERRTGVGPWVLHGDCPLLLWDGLNTENKIHASVQLTDPPSNPGGAVQGNNPLISQASKKNHSDGSSATLKRGEPSMQPDEGSNHEEEEKEPENGPSPNEDDPLDGDKTQPEKPNEDDGDKSQPEKAPPGANKAESGAGGGDCKGVEKDPKEFSPETPSPQNHTTDKKVIERIEVETLAPEEKATPPVNPEGAGVLGGDCKGVEKDSKEFLPETASPQNHTTDKKVIERIDEVETLAPEEKATPPVNPEGAGVLGGNGKYWVPVVIVVIIAILGPIFQPQSQPEKKDIGPVDIFLQELDRMKTQFPNQHLELWRRSRIHLMTHLQTDHPTEPVSLMLTAGHSAERTLHCLAKGLASAFSSALKASVLHIDGASKANQDSDQVKLDIDSQLQKAFEGNKPVAVIHRFEELPPSSTLIFYRYCDHESAAYKGVSLIFTVLLTDKDKIPAQLGLGAVEEMVDDHLQRKFLTFGDPIAFNRMDPNKYGGLWSRISHLILPVVAEERTEQAGC